MLLAVSGLILILRGGGVKPQRNTPFIAIIKDNNSLRVHQTLNILYLNRNIFH